MIATGINALEAITKSIHKSLSKQFNTRSSTVTIPIKPVAASRPRLSRYGVYYSKTYTDWRNEARRHVAQIETIHTGALIVIVEISVMRPKTSKKLWPRSDVDNLAKGPLDVITENKGIWGDDDQIVGLWVTKRFTLNPAEAGMVISIYGADNQQL
jgi:Holliday junction resolvase RusA-like endonuclease